MSVMSDHWSQAVEALRHAGEIVVFTGAGVSAESGIATFRDADGFWQRFPPEQFANWEGLLRTAATHPRRFAEFVLAVLEPIAAAQPNPAHLAIAEMERHARVTVVTQNIDGLHQEAGSTLVKEIHGTLLEIVDAFTGRLKRLITRRELSDVAAAVRRAAERRFAAARVMQALRPIFGLSLTGGYRPNLVLFGDAMNEPDWSQSLEAAKSCDVLLSVGTSGAVYPAASLPCEAQSAGVTVVTIDPEESGPSVWLRGRAGEMLPRLVGDAFH